MRFRPAVQDDLPAILELVLADRYASTREDASNLECYQGAFERIQQSPDNELIVGVLDGCIVATLQLTFIPGLTYEGGWRAQVEAVRVCSDLRSRGVGTQLMNWVIARARERGCCLVQLTTDLRRVDAKRFYQRLGFVASHAGMKLKL